jgi:hypothetical protein
VQLTTRQNLGHEWWPPLVLFVRNLGPPSFDDLDLNVLMEPASVPDNALCLNTETKGVKGMELIHPLEGLVVIQGGEKQLTYPKSGEFRPGLPWLKNQDIKNLYESHCHYRSPGAPADCIEHRRGASGGLAV